MLRAPRNDESEITARDPSAPAGRPWRACRDSASGTPARPDRLPACAPGKTARHRARRRHDPVVAGPKPPTRSEPTEVQKEIWSLNYASYPEMNASARSRGLKSGRQRICSRRSRRRSLAGERARSRFRSPVGCRLTYINAGKVDRNSNQQGLREWDGRRPFSISIRGKGPLGILSPLAAPFCGDRLRYSNISGACVASSQSVPDRPYCSATLLRA